MFVSKLIYLPQEDTERMQPLIYKRIILFWRERERERERERDDDDDDDDDDDV